MTKVSGRVKVADYYRFSWQILLVAACSLAIAAHVARPLVIIGYFLLSTLMVSSLASTWRHLRRAVSLAIGGSLLILVTQKALQASQAEDFVSILIEIICGALPWLLISFDKPRSYWLATLDIAVMAVGSMTVGSSALVYIGFLLVITLLMLNLNAANLYFGSSDQNERLRELPRGYFRQFVYVIPIGFAAAVVIFLLFPRVQSFTLSLAHDLGSNHTGYTGLVNLTADGEVMVSHSLALMIESEDTEWLKQNATTLLMRGDALDTFKGTKWESSNYNYHAPQGAHLQALAEGEGRPNANVRKFTVHQEPSAVSSLFYPGELLSVVGVSSANMHFLINQNGHLIRDPIGTDRIEYEVQFLEPVSPKFEHSPVSSWGRDSFAQVKDYYGQELSQSDIDRYLAVPEKIATAPYFRNWLAELNITPASATLPAIERRLLQVFTSSFQSTLANSFSGTDALAAFLTKDRRGHCEYFATAAALTLRALGVPSRLVVGFRGGLYNDVIGTLDVRDEDAHAWVEILVPGAGWQIFDPTPMTRDPSLALVDRWQMLSNSLNFWLHRYIIDYDQTTQKELLAQLRDFSAKSPEHLLDFHATDRQIRFAAATLAILGGSWYFMYRKRRRSSRTRNFPAFYLSFTDKLASLGLMRETGESLARFHARAAIELLPDQNLTIVDQAIHIEMYGPTSLPGEEKRQLKVLMDGWHPILRHQR